MTERRDCIQRYWPSWFQSSQPFLSFRDIQARSLIWLQLPWHSAVSCSSALLAESGASASSRAYSRNGGGTPTTQLLLQSASSLDHLTLQRYRQFLEARVSGLRFPGVESEAANVKNAIAVCESSVKWLREATRDTKKFPLVFSENTNYGFRRNLLGVKPAALFLSIATLLAVGAHAWIAGITELSGVPVQSWLAGAVALVGLLFWIFVVTPAFVKTTAFAYATALLATCDSPHLAPPPSKTRKVSDKTKS